MTRGLNPKLRSTIRLAVTGVALVAAAIGINALWGHYQADPWTRDGRVRADVVQVAPDVAGLVTRVLVVNDQHVRRGDVLFVLDRARFALAAQQAQTALVKADAGVLRARAELAEARREAARNRGLGDLVAAELTQQSEAKVAEAEAALAEAQSVRAQALDTGTLARLDLDRAEVRAPTDGDLSDLTLRVGDYVGAGKPVLALVDSSSLRIEGYFEETKLASIHIGQSAQVRLMGDGRVITGHVTSIAPAIEDHDRIGSTNLLPAINPSFSWVRLAQRVPVRIAIDHAPRGIALIAGRTATVTLARPAEPRR